MFRVNLRDLRPGGTLPVEGRIEADDPLWEGTDLGLTGPLQVEVVLSETGTGQLLARGRIVGALRNPCRRCLAEVRTELEIPVEWVWSPPDLLEEGEEGDDDEEIRTLPGPGEAFDLSDAIREEVVLAAPARVLCQEGCRGLCPRCGANWNEEDCDCARAEPDPRWAALRAQERE